MLTIFAADFHRTGLDFAFIIGQMLGAIFKELIAARACDFGQRECGVRVNIHRFHRVHLKGNA